MARPRPAAATLAVVAGLLLTVLLASPATAAVSAAQKASVLASWTQATAASSSAWRAARANQAAWAAYAFDWSTDYCTTSPDQPLGFDFRTPCARHDFGYRNYRAIGTFDANKSRVDDAFYADLKTVCATYSVFVRSACNSLAWSYYQAVRAFGSLAAVTAADFKKAEQLKAAGLRTAAKAGL